MTLRGAVTVATALICLAMVDSCQGKAAPGAQYCCTTFTRSPVPFRRIRYFKIQSALENCHRNAIIFYTVANKRICASERDVWVQRVLERLSKKMAKGRPTSEKKLHSHSGTSVMTSTRGVPGTTESSQNITLFFNHFNSSHTFV